ncbi:hypothetical protein FOZ63_012734, partial [Perkinsus olseni]
QQLVVVTDSEVTVYRLRRPSNDSKLPAPEQRRLSAVRRLCLELNAHIKHVPSGLNMSDSISRCVSPKTIDIVQLYKAISSSTVVYDPHEEYSGTTVGESKSLFEDAGCGQAHTHETLVEDAGCGQGHTQRAPLEDAGCGQAHTIASLLEDEDYSISIDDLPMLEVPELTSKPTSCNCLQESSTPVVNLINCDGLDLPNIEGSELNQEEKDELKALLEFVDTSRGSADAPSSTLDDIEFKHRLTVCSRRCQDVDDDLSKFRDYLEGNATSTSIGLRRTVFERMSKHCQLDADGIIRQRRWYSSSVDADEDGGTIYLGNSKYAYLLLCVIAAIYHYSYGHPGQRRLRLIMKRCFTAR